MRVYDSSVCFTRLSVDARAFLHLNNFLRARFTRLCRCVVCVSKDVLYICGPNM